MCVFSMIFILQIIIYIYIYFKAISIERAAMFVYIISGFRSYDKATKNILKYGPYIKIIIYVFYGTVIN